jgi:hypothetical protein
VTDRTLTLAGIISTLVLVSGFLALSIAGKPTEAYVLFVSGPLVSGVVGVILSRKVNAVAETTEQVKAQVNGALSGRFDQLEKQAEDIAHRPIQTTLTPPTTTLSREPTTLSSLIADPPDNVVGQDDNVV